MAGMNAFLPAAEQEAAIFDLMRRAGDVMTSALDAEEQVDVKPGTHNYVTAYDVKVQRFLIGGLAAVVPKAGFLGEEEDRHVLPSDRPCFVIDPIDGTLNFIHDWHTSVISVGIVDRGGAVWGAVWNPYTGDLFHARKGGGAYRNGEPIRVSAHPLSEALVGVGTSPYIRLQNHRETFALAEDLFLRCDDLRRSGAAAWDFCLIACGRLEVMYELSLGPWDYCAGSVILSEAGGILTCMDGSPVRFDRNCSVLAANALCHAPVLERIQALGVAPQN